MWLNCSQSHHRDFSDQSPVLCPVLLQASHIFPHHLFIVWTFLQTAPRRSRRRERGRLSEETFCLFVCFVFLSLKCECSEQQRKTKAAESTVYTSDCPSANAPPQGPRSPRHQNTPGPQGPIRSAVCDITASHGAHSLTPMTLGRVETVSKSRFVDVVSH